MASYVLANGHVTLKGQTCDSNTLRAQCLEYGRRQRLGSLKDQEEMAHGLSNGYVNLKGAVRQYGRLS